LSVWVIPGQSTQIPGITQASGALMRLLGVPEARFGHTLAIKVKWVVFS
jgi:hypothetical protein